MRTNNNYQPRKPMGDWLATIFWGIVIMGIIAYCINKISELL